MFVFKTKTVLASSRAAMAEQISTVEGGGMGTFLGLLLCPVLFLMYLTSYWKAQ